MLDDVGAGRPVWAVLRGGFGCEPGVTQAVSQGLGLVQVLAGLTAMRWGRLSSLLRSQPCLRVRRMLRQV